MKYHVVTTCAAKHWAQYGRRMAESFVQRWTRNASLTVYAEGFEVDVEGVAVRQLPEWLNAFKAEHGRDPAKNGDRPGGYHYIFDAVRFSHKVAAMTDFSQTLTDGIMIWLDADTFTHSDVTDEWLASLFPASGYIAWLDRKNAYPETGMIFFNVAHPFHVKLMARLEDFYTSGKVFGLAQTHDAFVIKHLVDEAFAERKIPQPVSLSGRAVRTSNPFCLGPLSGKLDHFKGNRKQVGRTPKQERAWFIRDSHPYWAQ